MESASPAPTGMTQASSRVTNDPVQLPQYRLGRLQRLGELAGEYAFYTPALLHVYGQLPFDPLTEFLQSTRRELEGFSVRFSQPIFEGLEVNGDASWNHVLYAMAWEPWWAYRNWLQGLALVDREQQRFSQTRWQSLTILDPLFLERATVVPATVPQVEITVFGLETNHGRYFLRAPVLTGLRPQAARDNEVPASVQQFAQAVLHDENYIPPDPEVRPAGTLQLPDTVQLDQVSPEHRAEIEKALQQWQEVTKS